MIGWSVHALERFDQRFPNRTLSNLPYDMIERHAAMYGNGDDFSVTFCEMTFKCRKFGSRKTLIKTVHEKTKTPSVLNGQLKHRVPKPYVRDKQRWEFEIDV